MNVNLLKSKLVLKDISVEALSDILKEHGISIHKTTLYRKIKGLSEFQRDEIQTISKVLDLTQDEILEIFFKEHLS